MSGPAAASATPGPARLCSVCDRELSPIAATRAEVTVGTVAATAIGPVGYGCPVRTTDGATGDPTAAGHDLVVPDPAARREALTGTLEVASRSRLRGRLRCGACATPFRLPGRRTTRTVTITHDGPAITVTLDVPALRCVEDAIDNVPPEALDDAVAALDLLIGGGS